MHFSVDLSRVDFAKVSHLRVIYGIRMLIYIIMCRSIQPKVDDKGAAVEHNSGGRRTGSATTEGKHDDVARLSGIRASALLLFFLLLESADRDALALILTFKAKVWGRAILKPQLSLI